MSINTNIPRYVQVNIGQGQLLPEDWEGFERDVKQALEDSTRGDSPSIEVHFGSGKWGGWWEESVHISTVADVDTYALRVKLAELKAKYRQDAIALIVGSDLV